ncbi:hypothetical protein [Paraburkholderia sp. A3RO-2L]|jgi:hypothetical protein|uniref:hypothetical protein n=1 Tax=unclassified Paraburkholderia TaxID=2615204 RepID=UPI003DA819E9
MVVKCLASAVVLTALAAPAFADTVSQNAHRADAAQAAASAQTQVQTAAANEPKTRAKVKAELAAYVAAGRPGSDLYRGN